MKSLNMFLVVILAFGLSGCDVNDGSSCSVIQLQNGGAEITCDDGSSAVVAAPALALPAVEDDEVPCTIVVEENQTILRCNDGTEAVLNTTEEDDPIVDDRTTVEERLGDLNAEELAESDVLRSAIEHGLGVGSGEYVEKVTLSLQSAGVLSDYESTIDDDWSNVNEEMSMCPFAEYYSNGFQSSGVNCDFLVELAQLDAYAALTAAMEDAPLDDDIQGGSYSEQANFWYEQGAVSGIEQRRVLVRADLREQAMCTSKPTPNEGSFDKGYTVGSQIMADAFNGWLEANGHAPDYPAMATPIDVCNIDASVLAPAYQDALDNNGYSDLCDDYVPPTQQHALEYAQAVIEYEKGIKAGIDAEYSLATVRIFREVPCNVSDPIVVDLDGDGIEILPIYRGVNFDIYNVGRLQATAWASPDDGFLVLDRDGDSKITNGGEFFGDARQDGFTHLAFLDANGDGYITDLDPAWDELAVWQDINTDGVSQSTELLTLSELGLRAIPVIGNGITMRDGDTRIPLVATATGVKSDMLLGDAFLQTAPWQSPTL